MKHSNATDKNKTSAQESSKPMLETKEQKIKQMRMIPEGAIEQKYPDADLTVFRFEMAGSYFYKAFKGNKSKPAMYCRFRSEEHLETNFTQFLHQEKAAFARKNSGHGLLVGDIVFTTWGYEQTNADFFEVIRVPSDKSAVIREIESIRKETGFAGSMSGNALPVPGQYKNGTKESLRRTADFHTLTNSGGLGGWLRKWDGQPVSVSWYA